MMRSLGIITLSPKMAGPGHQPIVWIRLPHHNGFNAIPVWLAQQPCSQTGQIDLNNGLRTCCASAAEMNFSV